MVKPLSGGLIDNEEANSESLTASNLVFGMLSIISTYNAEYFLAAVFIIIAMIADGLDGRAARYLKLAVNLVKNLIHFVT